MYKCRGSTRNTRSPAPRPRSDRRSAGSPERPPDRRDGPLAPDRQRAARRAHSLLRRDRTSAATLETAGDRTMSAPTPLLDFFKRGEVARDVRMQAAQGALAPRALEQMSILILLLEDQDEEVRTAAERTINNIPGPALAAFLARSDAPLAMREFFAARGV